MSAQQATRADKLVPGARIMGGQFEVEVVECRLPNVRDPHRTIWVQARCVRESTAWDVGALATFAFACTARVSS